MAAAARQVVQDAVWEVAHDNAQSSDCKVGDPCLLQVVSGNQAEAQQNAQAKAAEGQSQEANLGCKNDGEGGCTHLHILF